MSVICDERKCGGQKVKLSIQTGFVLEFAKHAHTQTYAVAAYCRVKRITNRRKGVW